MNANCIEIIGLTYLNIFNNFSVAFEKEKFITISGPNNCGKTTLIRIISNEIQTKNSILLYGEKTENYKITDFSKIIKSIIPLEITLIQSTVEDELTYQLSNEIKKDECQKKVKQLAKDFQLTKILTKSVDNLSKEEIVRLQLALSIINNPKIIIIDDLSPYFSKKNLLDIIKILKKINIEKKISIIMIASNLEISLQSDYIYVINNSKIILEGTPIEVLEKDNILNKSGLNLPFMIDLSVKLRDYDLIKKLELDMDRMVDTLWN